MKPTTLLITFFTFSACAIFVSTSHAQFNSRFGGGGYNQGGYNQQYGGGGYNQQYGGGGYNQGIGGSSRFGGGGFSQGGSSRFGGGGFSSRGSRGRSSRGGFGSGGYGAQQYGGYDQGGYGSQQYGGRGSRSRGSSSRFGQQGMNNPYGGGGNFINFGQQQQGGNVQTEASRTNAARNNALQGENNAGGESSISVQAGTEASKAAGTNPAAARANARATGRSDSSAPQRTSATLYLDSSSNIAVVDEPVDVQIMLSNSNKREFDELTFTVKYNPDLLRPVTRSSPDEEWTTSTELILFEDREEDLTRSRSQSVARKPSFMFKDSDGKYSIEVNEIDHQAGEIRFSAITTQRPSQDNGIIGIVRFLPLGETNRAQVAFEFGEENSIRDAKTRLTEEGSDVLGTKTNTRDGVVNLSLTILSSRERDEDAQLDFKRTNERGNLLDDDDGTPSELRLRLIPRIDTVDVGDTIDVDIYLENPSKRKIDTVSLLIAYNPRILQPVDGDERSLGLNLTVNEYKDRFPFDFSKVNTIDKDKGLIDFRTSAYTKTVRGEGIIASVRFRTIRPTTRTTFRVLINESKQDPTTGVFFQNQDMLGNPLDAYDAIETASLTVQATVAYINWYREQQDEG